MNNKYTVGELFSGVGGLSKAFQLAGTKIIWANELDIDACNIYKENFSEAYLYTCDIKDVKSEDIPDSDILVAKYPVQSFSLSENIKVSENGRKNLFFEILRLLREKRPRVFLLESDKAIRSQEQDTTFRMNIRQLEELGYYLKWQSLNPIEYGNIPYRKTRMYIVGFRDLRDCNVFSFPEKIALNLEINNFINTDEKEKDSYYCMNKKYYELYYSKLEELIVRKDMIYQLKPIFSRNKIILEECNFCSILSTYNIPLINDSFGIRKLTPIECFNFQGFSNLEIQGSVSETKLYKYAVTCSSVSVVERIAKNIISAIDNRKQLDNYKEELLKVNSNFRYHKKVLYEFQKENKQASNLICFDFNTHNENKSGDIDQQITFEDYVDKLEKMSEKDESEESKTSKLINDLSKIKPGIDYAGDFHDCIFESIKFIFDGYLMRQKKEVRINEGRKRIDITFDNLREKGFFYELRNLYEIFCPKIIIECKNYSSNIKNPEIDQLIGRLNDRIGKFGILICRNIENKKVLNKTCQDALHDHKKYIMVLCDADIKELLNLRKKFDAEGINNYLRDKLDELIM